MLSKWSGGAGEQKSVGAEEIRPPMFDPGGGGILATARL